MAALAVSIGLLAGTSGASAAQVTCLQPVAPDGHEPLCNPFVASDWALPHRNAYEQDSTPYPGPEPGRQVAQQHVTLQTGSLPFLEFSAPYADGGREVWFSEVSSGFERVGKVDFGTGQPIDQVQVPTGALVGTSGAYNLLDREGHFVVGSGQTIGVYGDSVPGDRTSPIRQLQTVQLPAAALCGSDDHLVGIAMMFDGALAFATANGVVGTIPDRLGEMDAAHVRAISIDPPSACADPNAPKEEVSNSIAVDEHGGIYTVTSAAQYKHVWDGHTIREAWRVPYRSDGYQGGIRLGSGSGSSPTLMGTGPGDDKLVAITDGQRVMHLLLLWRDRIPARWRPPPGDDRRVACDVRVDFGDPGVDKAQSEQSVAVRGYASVVDDNSLKSTVQFDSLPGTLHYQAAVFDSGDPTNAAHGQERIDWDPRTRSCHVVWVNRDVSLPNAIPTISSGSGLVYAIGQRGGVWGLEGVNFATGRSSLRIDTGPDPSHNSVYADTEVGPDGTIWTGTYGGIDIFRPAAGGATLPLRCRDLQPPVATISRGGIRASTRRLDIPGRASDDGGCGVASVQVAVARVAGGHCRWLGARGRLGPASSCRRPHYLPAAGGARWRFARPVDLPAGRYVAKATASDRSGNAQSDERGASTARFRVVRRSPGARRHGVRRRGRPRLTG